MAGRRTEVLDIRELIRRYRLGESDRGIARDTGIDRKTVGSWRDWAEGQGFVDGDGMPEPAAIAERLKATTPEPSGGPPSSVEKWRALVLNCFREELDGLQDWCKKSDFASRDEKIAKLAELLTDRRRLGKRYFSGQITKDGRLEYLAKQRVLAYEKLLDGTTILKTNNRTLSDADVVARYKELAKIERAFRDLKSLIDLRPIYHRTARRVSAHVFLCVLALLLEGVLDRKLRQAKVEDLSAAAAFQEMRRLRLLRDKVDNVEVSRLSAPSALQKQILAALGIKEPAALVGVKTLKKPKS